MPSVGRSVGRSYVFEPKLLQLLQLRDLRRQLLQRVAAQVEVPQVLRRREGVDPPDRRQPVVVERHHLRRAQPAGLGAPAHQRTDVALVELLVPPRQPELLRSRPVGVAGRHDLRDLARVLLDEHRDEKETDDKRERKRRLVTGFKSRPCN